MNIQYNLNLGSWNQVEENNEVRADPYLQEAREKCKRNTKTVVKQKRTNQKFKKNKKLRLKKDHITVTILNIIHYLLFKTRHFGQWICLRVQVDPTRWAQ
jgi:hypothetical protein